MGVPRGSFKVSKRHSKSVSRQFQRCFKEDSRVLKKVSSVLQENFVNFFSVFQESFKKVLLCNFVVA